MTVRGVGRRKGTPKTGGRKKGTKNKRMSMPDVVHEAVVSRTRSNRRCGSYLGRELLRGLLLEADHVRSAQGRGSRLQRRVRQGVSKVS